MASATATASPDPGRPKPDKGGEKRGWRRLTALWPPGSRLGRLIVLLNLIGLAVLISGALVLNELRRGLVEARIDSLTTQGEFIVKVLDETATVGDPAPALQAAEASDFLQILFIPRGQRARLFDAQGQLVADSYAVADRVESAVLPPARKPGEKPLLPRPALSPRANDRAENDLKATRSRLRKAGNAKSATPAICPLGVSAGPRVLRIHSRVSRIVVPLDHSAMRKSGLDL